MSGATGIIGSRLAPALLERGHMIIALVRDAQNREQQLRERLGLNREANSRFFVLSADITQEIDVSALIAWPGGIDKVLHVAGSTKFKERDGILERTNVHGTALMLYAAQQLGAQFYHASTIYVEEASAEFSAQDISIPGRGGNDYEDSKIRAEKLVRSFSGPFTILRLPIVIGDSQTGEILNFSGYCGFFAALWSIRPRFERKGETYTTSLHIRCSDTGTLQLLPIDWETEVFVHLVEMSAVGETFQLIHPNPPKITQVIIDSLEHLQIQGITCGSSVPPQANLDARLQPAMERGLKQYEIYTLYNRVYRDRKLPKVLQNAGLVYNPPPRIDRDLLGRQLDYAIAHNFGRSQAPSDVVPVASGR